MKCKLLITIIILLGIIACNNDDDNSNNCDQTTVISSAQFANAPTDQLTINNLEINENCLIINFSSSGCNGDTWELKLIDSEAILETAIPQRNLRLSLKNEELCEAFITKEITFNIKELQIDGNQVFLNLTNSDLQILYEY